MSSAPVFNKEKKAQIRGELEDLLRGYSPSSANPEDDVLDNQLSEIAVAPPLDFEKMNREFEKQAKDITNSMLKFYVDLGVLDKHDYVKQKQTLDNSSIQNIFFQLKTLRMAIEKIAEEINQGNTHPRLFEVFGQLQDKLTTVIKTQANYVLFLEDTYKKINQDVTQKGVQSDSITPLLNKPNEYYITAGTKNIMRDMSAEEVTDIDKAELYLTNPEKKSQVMEAAGVSPSFVEDEVADLSDDVNSLI